MRCCSIRAWTRTLPFHSQILLLRGEEMSLIVRSFGLGSGFVLVLAPEIHKSMTSIAFQWHNQTSTSPPGVGLNALLSH